jgi:hypothetical protein
MVQLAYQMADRRPSLLLVGRKAPGARYGEGVDLRTVCAVHRSGNIGSSMPQQSIAARFGDTTLKTANDKTIL